MSPAMTFGRWEVIGVVKRLVTQPGDVEVDFVARDEFVIGERIPSLRFDTLVSGLSTEIEVDELVEVMPTHWVRFEGEVQYAQSLSTRRRESDTVVCLSGQLCTTRFGAPWKVALPA